MFLQISKSSFMSFLFFISTTFSASPLSLYFSIFMFLVAYLLLDLLLFDTAKYIESAIIISATTPATT